jgi:hypothetical protein
METGSRRRQVTPRRQGRARRRRPRRAGAGVSLCYEWSGPIEKSREITVWSANQRYGTSIMAKRTTGAGVRRRRGRRRSSFLRSCPRMDCSAVGRCRAMFIECHTTSSCARRIKSRVRFRIEPSAPFHRPLPPEVWPEYRRGASASPWMAAASGSFSITSPAVAAVPPRTRGASMRRSAQVRRRGSLQTCTERNANS